MPCPLVFVLPEDRTAISGGNLYNRRLLEALGDRRGEIEGVNLAEGCARLEQGRRGLYLVDSLLLEDMPELTARAGAGQPIFMLTHYLPSLEPNRASAAAAARDRALIRDLDGFVVTSAFMRDRLGELYRQGRPVLVVPPALALVPSEGELARRSAGDRRFRGLMVANLNPVKGVLELLQRLDPLLAAEDGFSLDIAGRLDLDQGYATACQRVVEGSPRLERAVRFRGGLDPERLREAYAASTIFISASRMESYGMAMHEARAFGLPVLALDAGNVCEHVSSGERGILFGSIAELAEGCVALIRDPDGLARLGRTAFAHRPTETYSWADAAELLLTQIRSWAVQRS